MNAKLHWTCSLSIAKAKTGSTSLKEGMKKGLIKHLQQQTLAILKGYLAPPF